MSAPTAPEQTSDTGWVPRGRPRLLDTQTFVFWVAVVATGYSAFHLFSEITGEAALEVAPANGWLALVLWSLYALVFLAIVVRFQLFVRRSPWITLGALLWGGVTATYFAGLANAALEDILSVWLGSDADERWITAVSAATNEEMLKTLGVVVLVLLPLVGVRSTLDGWWYGMMIGLGFQVVEDFIYTIQQSANLSEVAGFLVQRGFFAGLWAHAVYSGIVGAGIGYLVSRRDRGWGRRIAVGVGSFAIAWFLHLMWDAPFWEELFGEGGGAFVLTLLVKGVPALALLLFVVHRARDHERGVWSAFVSANIDEQLVPPADAAALLDHRSRAAARREAAQRGGTTAKHACRELQTAQLRYVQAVDEEGPTSAAALQWAARIDELRPLVAPAAPA